MKSLVRALYVVLVLLIGAPANMINAQEVPKEARGIWNLGACDEGRAAVLISADFALLFETTASQGQVVAMGPVKWSGETSVLWQGGKPTILPPVKAMRRCQTMPPAAYASLGEAISLLLTYDQIATTCATQRGRDCAGVVFDFADVSGDDRLSLAEISRILRAVAIFAAYEGMIQSDSNSATKSIKVPVNSLTGTAMFVSLVAPVMTRNLVASYDFDGDGFVSLAEIMQDREPLFDQSVTAGTGTALGMAAAQAAMSVAVTFLLENAGQMMGSFAGGLLR